MRTAIATWAGLTGSAVLVLVLGCGGGGPNISGAGGASITGVTLSPTTGTVTIGATLPFTATVSGTGAYDHSVSWLVTGPSSWTGSAGSVTTSTTDTTLAVYESPYPAPATVTITAVAGGDESKSATATVTLVSPAAATGPLLIVDANNELHAINPYIYGMNGYQFVNAVDGAANVPLVRWGGDGTSRYNWQLNVSSSASDWYFENQSGSPGVGPTGSFNDLVTSDRAIGAATLGTVPVLGWVAKDATACSYPTATYPTQYAMDAKRGCGDGMYPQGTGGCASKTGCNIPDAQASDTSVAEGPAFAGAWVASLVQAFGSAAQGGVAIWDLDNEPSWWDAVHRDVHPAPFTYDEVTNNGIATALAVKTADPTAAVSGPVMDYWWDYFYSKKDVESGWSTGPCYEPWSNPVDREAHGGKPLIEYYLQQFAEYDATHSQRLLDYLDIHGYFSASYNGAATALTTAGDSVEQLARLNSTRALWDPTYTDPQFPQPNYLTDNGYTSLCSTPLQAPELIPRLEAWVAKDYPGTKTAIDEYNWGGQEHINGALAQADVLGIFGQFGLDLAALWGPPSATQTPGLMAFEMYRNYDGANSKFGDMALASCSGATGSCAEGSSSPAAQNQLAVYGALRTADHVLTVVVINKTYGALTSSLLLEHLAASGNAEVFEYSADNLAAIAELPGATVTAPAPGSTTSTVSNYTFPAASITLFVIPTQ